MDQSHRSRISPEYVLLGFLYHHSNHGYDLHKQLLQNFGNIWRASQSQTYNILKRLDTQGYITSTEKEQQKHPARLVLEITPAGKERFETWLKHPTNSSVHAIRIEFVSRLYFTHLYHPENIVEMIREQIEVVKAGLSQLQGELAQMPGDAMFNKQALALRIKLLYSVISWLYECDQMFGSLEEKK